MRATMDLRSVTTVTLDAGGTLLFPHPSVGAVYSEVLAAHGCVMAPDEIERRFQGAFSRIRLGPRPHVDDSSEKAFWMEFVTLVIGSHCPPALFPEVFEDIYREFADARRWRLAPDGLTTLEGLRGRGYRLALLSNADSRLRGILEQMEIAQQLEHLFISAEVGFEKPDPRLFRHVEAVLAVRPPEVLHVGDSPFHDLQGARQAGWHCLILGEATDPGRGVIGSLNDLLDLL